MANTNTGALTQEVQAALSAEMLIQPDDIYLFFMNGPIQRADQDAMVPGTNIINFNRPVLPTGTYTEASRRLVETTAIPLTALAISMTQVALTIREYAGPHDGTAINPFGVTEFFRNRSKHNVIMIIGEFLRRDYNRFVDQTVNDLLMSATTVQTPDGSAEGVIAAGQGATVAWLQLINKALKDGKVPSFPNGNWRMIFNTRDEMLLKQDATYREQIRYTSANPLFKGFMGTYEGIDMMTSTMLATKLVGAGSLVTGYQSAIFGPYGLGWGRALPPSVRKADDTDYGRQERVIWKSEEVVGTLYTDLIFRGLTT